MSCEKRSVETACHQLPGPGPPGPEAGERTLRRLARLPQRSERFLDDLLSLGAPPERDERTVGVGDRPFEVAERDAAGRKLDGRVLQPQAILQLPSLRHVTDDCRNGNHLAVDPHRELPDLCCRGDPADLDALLGHQGSSSCKYVLEVLGAQGRQERDDFHEGAADRTGLVAESLSPTPEALVAGDDSEVTVHYQERRVERVNYGGG